MILIGPGTGIAPFRSFVRTRLFQSQASDKGPVGDVLVFFGCRNALHDYLYEDEWEELQKSGFFARMNAFGGIVVAFSRPTQNEKKKYVQNRITDEEKRVWSFLEAGAKIFVAGAAEKMPTAVREAIQKVVQSQGSRSEKESSIYMTKMDTNGRYFVDAW
jgi:sulfite reductase alpha subunit-like flavoprotein